MIRTASYFMAGVAGAMAFKMYQENSTKINRSMRRMMRNNTKTMKQLRSIF